MARCTPDTLRIGASLLCTTDPWWNDYWVRRVSMYYRQRAWQSRG